VEKIFEEFFGLAGAVKDFLLLLRSRSSASWIPTAFGQNRKP
jgi:hypothetical protein